MLRRCKTESSFARPRDARIGTGVSRSLKCGVGLIYDRLDPESSGAIFSSSYIKIRKLLAAETRPQIIVCHPAERMAARNGGAVTSVATRRDATRAERARRRIYIILSGQWTERCLRSLATSLEYPRGSAYVFHGSFTSKPGRGFPFLAKGGKTRKLRQMRDRGATTGIRGDRRSGWPI